MWDATIAIEEWPLWSPTIRGLQRLDTGAFGLGSQARILQPMQPASIWTVIAFDPGCSFSWETRRRGLYMLGSHRVEDKEGGTRSLLALRAEGALASLFAPLLRAAIRSALRQENEAVKALCEGSG